MAEKTPVVEGDPAAFRLASYLPESAGHQGDSPVHGLEHMCGAQRGTPDSVALDITLPGDRTTATVQSLPAEREGRDA